MGDDRTLYGLLIGAGFEAWVDMRESIEAAFRNDHPVDFECEEDFTIALDLIPRRLELHFLVVANEFELSDTEMQRHCRALAEALATYPRPPWVVFVDEDLYYHLAKMFTGAAEVAFGLDDLALRAPWTRGASVT